MVEDHGEIEQDQVEIISEPAIGWAWYERDPAQRLDEVEDALAAITGNDYLIDDGSLSDDAVSVSSRSGTIPPR